MWYLLIAHDRPNSLAARRASRPAHLERLRALLSEQRLKLAGPMPAVDSAEPGEAGFVGSAMVVSFENRDAARAWANEDPYLAGGVYERVDVYPFIPVLP